MSWNTNTAILAQLETFSAETAWASLLVHFQPLLMRHAQRSGLPEDAVPDVVQEVLVTFALAYRRGTYDSSRGRLSGWMYGIARREVAGARRKIALAPLRAGSSLVEQEPSNAEDRLEAIWAEEWRLAILERCIERGRTEAEPITRECFSLQTFDGLCADEVAARLGLSRTKVYNARHRVSRRLRELARVHENA